MRPDDRSERNQTRDERSGKDRPAESKPGTPADRDRDVMRGRSFAGTNIANTERGQTEDRERVVRGELLDEAGEVTDAEIEAREEE